MIQLPRRERQVLEYLTEGHTERSIGKELHLAESTVKAHRASLYRRLGAKTSGQAVALAYKHGLLSAPGRCCERHATRLLRRLADQLDQRTTAKEAAVVDHDPAQLPARPAPGPVRGATA